MKVLIPISGHHPSNNLVSWTRKMRQALNLPCDITLLHVVAVPALEGSTGELVTEDVEATKVTFEQLAERYPGEFDFKLEAGDPGPVICRAAIGFDLVVVGGHHRSQISELLLGSTSNYVAHNAPCPVLIQRDK